MTWTKFDSLKRGEIVYDKDGQAIEYRWATGHKRSYLTRTISAAAVGSAVAALFGLLGYSILP